MKINFNNLIIAVTIAVVLFVITTFIQGNIVKAENMVQVIVLKDNVEKNIELDSDMLKLVEIPESIGKSPNLIKDINTIKNKVTKYPLLEGQILFNDMLIDKSQINKMPIDVGKQRITIKIKEIQDALSYKVSSGDNINLYFIGRYESIADAVYGSQVFPILTNEKGYCVVKILENEEILGTYNADGELIDFDSENKVIDTIMFALTEEKVKLIYALSPNGYFSITQGN